MSTLTPSAGTSPISCGFDDASIFTWWRGRPITHEMFWLHATALARELPESGALLNLCDDRAAFTLAWAAALLRGLTTVLPSDRTEVSIAPAVADSGATILLTDLAGNWNLPSPVKTMQIDFDAPTADGGISVPAVPDSRVAAILYSSGSTGKPMASVKRWGSLVSGARALGRMLGWQSPGAARHVIGAIAPQHMFGLETTVMLPLQWGASISPARPLLPADLVAALDGQGRRAWLMMTPLHASAYLSAKLDCGETLAGAVSSTMPLPPEIAVGLEALWQVPVMEIYGSTETGMIGLRRTSQSREWQLADDLTLEFSEHQTLVSGRTGMPAHLLNDQVQAGSPQRFSLLGRNSDIVKVGGKRASLARLNSILSAIEGVLDAVLLQVEDNDRLVALVVAIPGLDAAEIRRRLARLIDPVFLPRPLWLVDRLPRNDNGKLPRQALVDFVGSLRKA
ncbi:MAG: AMP-binding protein [Burkholderiales bacterium]